MITFHYKKEPTRIKNKYIYRPVAEVYLKTQKGNFIKFSPYIDSGADITLIPYSLGKLIGLETKRDQIQNIGGIKGSVPIIYEKVSIKIGQTETNIQVAWAQTEGVPTLLGREGIFDLFKVTFNQKDKTITFEEN
jgi:hypothetical protein